MGNEIAIVNFLLDKQKYALHYSQVYRVIQAVNISSLPNLSKKLLGIINVEGGLIPIINIRQQLGLVEQALQVSDYIIIAKLDNNSLGFVVNEIDFSNIANDQIEKKNGIQVIKEGAEIIFLLDVNDLVQENKDALSEYRN